MLYEIYHVEILYAIYRYIIKPWSLGQYQTLKCLSSLTSIQLCVVVLSATIAIKKTNN